MGIRKEMVEKGEEIKTKEGIIEGSIADFVQSSYGMKRAVNC